MHRHRFFTLVAMREQNLHLLPGIKDGAVLRGLQRCVLLVGLRSKLKVISMLDGSEASFPAAWATIIRGRL